jgi:hypothetical protein
MAEGGFLHSFLFARVARLDALSCSCEHVRRARRDANQVLRQPALPARYDRLGVRVAESAMAPPSSIPNLVVPHGSAGEYCAGNCVGGEAAARTPKRSCHVVTALRSHPQPPRGGAAAARWAHNPKVAGSNPAPATSAPGSIEPGALLCLARAIR